MSGSVALGKIGVLLVNLGTPDRADAQAVRIYLKEFLSDRRVIENQGLLWKAILNGIILRVRPAKKAKDYQSIWNNEANESPLLTITRAQATKLGEALGDSHVVVDFAMRYGNPSIKTRIDALCSQGCDRLLVVPLYPQYSAATTATVCDEVFRVLSGMRAQPALRVAPPYFTEPSYIDAIARSIEEACAAASPQPERVLVSFHGMPQRYVDQGDPYYVQCAASVEALKARLGALGERLVLCFQSRFGREPWLQPYTDETVAKLAREGVRAIAVVTPGFAADCLETLEEIGVENEEIFRHNGGEHFTFIPCLNDGAAGMAMLRQIVMRELQGWL